MIKMFITAILVCLLLPSCFIMVPMDSIAEYEQHSATQEQFNAAMDIFYERYPEYHMTTEVLKRAAENDNYHTPLDTALGFQRRFFRRDVSMGKGHFTYNIYHIKSKDDDIFILFPVNWLAYDDGCFDISFSNVLLSKDNYKISHSRSEKKMVKEVFKVDVLPKIQECLDIVRKSTAPQKQMAPAP
jgi:hypothetical protein